MHRRHVVGRVGFEPTTNGLKGRCSTTELPTRPNGAREAKQRLRLVQARFSRRPRQVRILTVPPTPSPPRSGGEGRGEEELRRNHWQAQIKSPSPQPLPSPLP